MRKPTKEREIGRGERVLPGVWRLRLPLPWPGVPHCNAWAIAAGDGIVLVDTGMHEPGSIAHLERALEQVNLRIEHVRLVVCTHAHSDHYGQATPIVERAGCELWMHPQPRAPDRGRRGPRRGARAAHRGRAPERRAERAARALGRVPPRAGHRESRARCVPTATSSPGVIVETDLGAWTVHETPGHAPSHVVLHQPERRLLLSGDHLLGRVSLYYDYGWSPDPVRRVPDVARRRRGARRAPRALRSRPPVHRRPGPHRRQPRARPRAPARDRTALSARARDRLRLAPRVYGELFTPATANWCMTKMLCYLRHLEHGGRGRARRGRPRALADRPLHRLPGDAHRRADRPERQPGVLLRVLPAEDPGGRGQPRGRAGRARTAGADVRLGHLRRRRHARAPRRSRSSRASRSATASRRWRTSPASAPRPTSCAPRSTACARRASTTSSPCAAIRRRARRSGRRPRAAWRTRASWSS